MLFIVNPFDTIHTRVEARCRCLGEKTLYHILDTDDLHIETVSYKELQYAVGECKLVLENISVSGNGEVMSIDAFGWSVSSRQSILTACNGSVCWDGDLKFIINGNNVEFTFQSEVIDPVAPVQECRLMANESLVCSWLDSSEWIWYSSSFLYLYIINDFLVLRFNVVLGGGTVVLFAVIMDLYGNIIAVLPDGKLDLQQNLVTDKTIAAKFQALYLRRY